MTTVTYMRRSDWTTHGPKRPLAPMPDHPQGFAVHWPGMTSGKAPRSQRDVAARLESYRVLHTSPGGIGTKDGGNDIAYQWCVDLEGRCWPLRGFDHQSGANGDGTVNRSHGAVLLMVGPDDDISAQLVAAVRDLRRRHWLTMYPKATAVVGHRDLHGTDCPGPKAYRLVRAGTFVSNPPTPEDDMPTPEEIAKAVWTHPVPDPWDGQASPAGDVLGSTRFYAVQGGHDGTTPKTATTAPGQPTSRHQLQETLDNVEALLVAIRELLVAQQPKQ